MGCAQKLRPDYLCHSRFFLMRRFVITLYLVLFIGVSVVSGFFLWQAHEEYSRLKEMEAKSRVRLAEAEQRLKEQQRILERLRTDPEYVEIVIRRRLGYVKPDEVVFRFED
jgi:cell division protein DivIC